MRLSKFETLRSLRKVGIVAVIRGYSQENSYKTAKACIDGGITAIELAFTSPNANLTIEKLSKAYSQNNDVIIGAGTVLDATTARLAIIAGAKFIVSPSFNKDTAKECNLYDIPYIPGCFSPTEIQSALTYGSDLIKIFPASITGKGIINEIQGPFPYVNVMPSGGVSLSNMQDWFESGAYVLGVGGSLVSPAKTDDYQSVRKNALAFKNEFNRLIYKHSNISQNKIKMPVKA